MEPVNQSLQEYIKSGKYFSDARKWHNFKYIYPISQRSILLTLAFISMISFISIIININQLFPLVVQIKYSIVTSSGTDKMAQIDRADQIENNPLISITDIFIKNYVIQREKYNYENLKKQFIFVQNNSTRIAFRKFYNFMNIDNPTSPVMQYQKKITREIDIISNIFVKNQNKSIVKFSAKAKSDEGKIVEEMVWQATVEYEIDKINPNLPAGSRFNFTVTNYQLQLLEQKKFT